MTENLAAQVQENIAKARQEEATPVGTLHRMAFKLHRLAKTHSSEELAKIARKVESFAVACAAELEFFRTIAGMPAQPTKTDPIRALQGWLRDISNFNAPMLKNIRFDAPFKLIEGVAVPENAHLNQLSGPFFIAVAGNFSEGHEWAPENRSYLFTFTDDSEQYGDQFELRELNDTEFKNSIAWRQGRDLRYRISLSTKASHRGSIQDVFALAVDDMSQYAFGPNSSIPASEAFTRAVENYKPTSRLTPLADVETVSLGSTPVPLALARTPSQ